MNCCHKAKQLGVFLEWICFDILYKPSNCSCGKDVIFRLNAVLLGCSFNLLIKPKRCSLGNNKRKCKLCDCSDKAWSNASRSQWKDSLWLQWDLVWAHTDNRHGRTKFASLQGCKWNQNSAHWVSIYWTITALQVQTNMLKLKGMVLLPCSFMKLTNSNATVSVTQTSANGICQTNLHVDFWGPNQPSVLRQKSSQTTLGDLTEWWISWSL